jgi:hypothetical protein
MAALLPEARAEAREKVRLAEEVASLEAEVSATLGTLAVKSLFP